MKYILALLIFSCAHKEPVVKRVEVVRPEVKCVSQMLKHKVPLWADPHEVEDMTAFGAGRISGLSQGYFAGCLHLAQELGADK